MKSQPKVAIIMGSESDMEIMKKAADFLAAAAIPCEVKVMSAHRNPEKVSDFAKHAEKKGFSVIIAGAGKAAHLPGVIAAYTTLPVIGVPILTKDLGGLDSLLSIVQMPSGVPVAAVAINGAVNAAILATQIIALADKRVNRIVKSHKKRLAGGSKK
jgi:5-(carboxyamino)imidazole ribonucleotide mutase